MANHESLVAVFADHVAAEAAVKKLAAGGLAMKHLNTVGRGYHTEESVVGFYNTGDRVRFWGALWGLFAGGVFLTTPLVGPVIALGYITASLVSALEGAVVVGGLSALSVATANVGVSRNSVVAYETAIAADSFLVMTHGPADEVAHAKAVLDGAGHTQLVVYGAEAMAPAAGRVVVTA